MNKDKKLKSLWNIKQETIWYLNCTPKTDMKKDMYTHTLMQVKQILALSNFPFIYFNLISNCDIAMATTVIFLWIVGIKQHSKTASKIAIIECIHILS